MAVTVTLVEKKEIEGGLVREKYRFVASGGDTTVTITTDETEQPQIVQVVSADVASDGDTAINKAYDQGPNKVKLTFTANDSGYCTITGKAA